MAPRILNEDVKDTNGSVLILVNSSSSDHMTTAAKFRRNEGGWRCRRELHPRMGVLQTPALLLGYGTKYQKMTRVSIEKEGHEEKHAEKKKCSNYSAELDTAFNVTLLRIKLICASNDVSTDTGVAAV